MRYLLGVNMSFYISLQCQPNQSGHVQTPFFLYLISWFNQWNLLFSDQFPFVLSVYLSKCASGPQLNPGDIVCSCARTPILRMLARRANTTILAAVM